MDVATGRARLGRRRGIKETNGTAAAGWSRVSPSAGRWRRDQPPFLRLVNDASTALELCAVASLVAAIGL